MLSNSMMHEHYLSIAAAIKDTHYRTMPERTAASLLMFAQIGQYNRKMSKELFLKSCGVVHYLDMVA